MAAILPAALFAQHQSYSTHDWQRLTAAGLSSSASWSDVKTPGDGRTYAIGSTWVDHTDHMQNFVQFSGVGGTGSSSPTQGPPLGPDGPGAIVAILQVADAQGVIQWQRFFHGDGGSLGPTAVTTTRGRSVSVFPGPTDLDTRIVICGETFDQRLPPFAAGSPESGLNSILGGCSGFVTVYNGRGDLLWDHLFFGHDPFGSTVITDVSIRVDHSGPVPLEIVTYCGASTNGRFDPNPLGSGPTPLSPPTNAFAAPTSAICTGTPYAAGDAANHPLGGGGAPDVQLASNNSDGIIGRLVRDTSTGTTTRQFHCIVGGYGNDALWGQAERDPDHFAVVGTTAGTCAGPVFFPVTRPYWLEPPAAAICFACPNNYHHGVVAEFDVSLVPLGGQVLLAGSTLIGASGWTSLARDVTWQGGEYYIVGSTNDPAFTGELNPCTQAKGFLVAAADLTDPSRLWTQIYTPRLAGPCQASGLVAVAGWNEHPDHISVLGWIQEQASGQKDLFVTTLFRDTTAGSAPSPLQEMRTHRIVTASDEFAAAIDGTISFPAAYAPSVFAYGYGLFPLGEGGGGGLAVDPLGRLTLTGSIQGPVASGFPVTTAPAGRAASAALSGPNWNGVLSRIDMLPAGVCRSDGTGSCPGTGWVPTGNGGTTPACALSMFGNLLGSPTPALQRMLVDYEGVPLPGQPVSLLVDRPPQSSAVVLSAWHVSIPANTPMHFPDQDVYIWVPSVTTSTIWGTYSPTGASLRESLGVFTQTGTFMVQYVCLLSQPLTGTPCTAPDLSWAVSPALVFTY